MNKAITLTEVAALGQIEQVTRLLVEGADPNERILGTLTRVDPDAVYMYSNEPVTHITEYDLPLVAAVSNNHTSVVELLLKHNADPKLPGLVHDAVWKRTEQQIPLKIAIAKNSPEMVRMLVAHGAVWDHNQMTGANSPLYYAIKNKHSSLASWLLASGLLSKVDLHDGSETSPLCLSIICGELEIAKRLIKLGVDVNFTEGHGGTALQHAASCLPPDSVELITLLVQAGADINASDDDWKTSLHSTVQFNLPQNVETLLEHGAKVNIMDKSGYSPLHLALFMSNGDRTEIINILLRYDADTYVVNKGLVTSSRPHSGKDALQMAELAGREYEAKPYRKAYAGIIRHHREQKERLAMNLTSNTADNDTEALGTPSDSLPYVDPEEILERMREVDTIANRKDRLMITLEQLRGQWTDQQIELLYTMFYMLLESQIMVEQLTNKVDNLQTAIDLLPQNINVNKG